MSTSLRCNEVLYSILYSNLYHEATRQGGFQSVQDLYMHSTTLLYSTLLYSTLLYSTLLYSTLLLEPKNCTCSNTQYIAYAQSTMLACLTHILSVDVASPCVVQYYLSGPYVQQIGLQLLQTEPYGMV